MRASRFFVEGIYEEGATVALQRGDAHKISHVLRLEAGDLIRIVDSSGSEFDATIARRFRRFAGAPWYARRKSFFKRQRCAHHRASDSESAEDGVRR